MKTDAVQQILEIVGSVANVDPLAMLRADRAIRREFGGTALKIQVRPPVTIEQVDAGLRARKPVALIAAEAGVSRSTIYRMLGRKRAKNRTNSDHATVARAK